MAVARRKGVKDTPEKQLQQALSEFEAVIRGEQRRQFLHHKFGPKPTPKDVIRFMTEIDSNDVRKRAGRPCVGTRLTNILQPVQKFTSVGDIIVGGR